MSYQPSRALRSSPGTPFGDRVQLVAGGAVSENDIVVVNGRQNGVMQAIRADADAVLTSRGLLFVSMGNAAANGTFDGVPWRLVTGVDTSTWAAAGDPVFMSGTAGGVTAAEGAQGVQVGEVLEVSATTGAYALAPNSAFGGNRHEVRRALVTIPGGNEAGSVGQLSATPVTLVAAQGADTFIEFVSAHLFLDFATAGYDSVGAGDDLVISYTNAAGQEVARVETVGFMDAVADAHRIAWPQGVAVATPFTLTPVANSPLVIHVLVGSLFAAAGDSPLVVEVLYRVRDLTPA